jgi:hypothetical protein
MFFKFWKKAKSDAGPHIWGRPPGLVAIIIYEAVWGFVQTISGVLLFFSYKFIADELMEDPQDLLLNWLISHLTYRGSIKLGALFVALGVIKLALAAGLVYHAKLTRMIGIYFFIAVALFGSYHLSIKITLFKLSVLAIDAFILYYFWQVLPKHFHDKGVT